MLWTQKATTRFFYKYFKYRKDKTSPNYLDKKQYVNLCADFFLLLQEELLQGKGYTIPYGLGEIKIIKRKHYNKMRNYSAEKKIHKETGIWKEVKFLNFHTGGYAAVISWRKKDIGPEYRKLYRFSPAFNLKKKLSKDLLETGNIDKYHDSQNNKPFSLNKMTTLI